MSSWFNNLASQITEVLPKVPDTFIPPTQNDIINALTFQTPEMAKERARIDQEECRKEAVKNALARLLPWETNNEEHEILVEECKELVLALSSNAGMGIKNSSSCIGGIDDKEKEEKKNDNKEENLSIFQQPFGCGDLEGELQAMEALEDYPRLLRVFDLDAHVGLIQRLFQLDKNLVEMHSNLSGAGEVEYNFWKNYFYHCAVIRSQIGLSNAEIWDQAVAPKVTSSTKTSSTDASSTNNDNDNSDIVTTDDGSITFESASVGSAAGSNHSNEKIVTTATETASETIAAAAAAETSTTTTSTKPAVATTVAATPVIAPTTSRERSPEKDYEIVSVKASNTATDSGSEGDLDDLEAEIARELAG